MANAQLHVKFITNRNGGQNLTLDGYIYRVNRRGTDKTFWRCVVPGCSASLSTVDNIPTGFGTRPHSHPADHTNVVAKQIMNKITKRCKEEVRPIPTIFTEELNKLRDNEWDKTCQEVVERLPTFNTAKSALYRARGKQTPKLPKTQQEIELDGKWSETSAGDRFLLFDDNNDLGRMITFATTESLQELANSDTFFCDGTFYTCPSLFYQIYSLHIKIDDIMTPVVYAFLPGKSQAVYTRFFSLLQDKMTDLGLDFAPTSAVLDFEVAVHNSLKNLFPGINTKGCFFHFTQCIWRKAQSTGLQNPYRDNEDVRTLVRRAAILPLIPLDCIDDVWFQTLEDRDDANLTPLTEPFTDYVTEQWVEGDRTCWNHFGTEGPRTNNSIEGWHSKIKKMTQHSHPNIYTAIQMFKDIQNSNEIRKIQIAAGGTIRPRAKKYLNIDRRLSILKERYQAGILDIMEYADLASQLLHLR